ncbi:MAG: hypothetical protein H6551_11115 [Chitinophagales bacterium]|nr:hypothetical protein [Chitinophagaceae bacterium]MCB9065675.1 hypothetical protein [Chitinophagales bacterium]
MKKLLIPMALLLILGATSCKKEYTCVCTEDGKEQLRQKAKDTKKNAENYCKEREQIVRDWGGGGFVKCSLL